uniref:Uncharacterized protein LOC104229269 n=1 Tax=Nicotiana sylvestris TaxID=4096 RepID=A0A1U7X125_NICSY|nr:PREDICTED: uncharacterized protein LOC104229269 [Nicotiana sylvestris]
MLCFLENGTFLADLFNTTVAGVGGSFEMRSHPPGEEEKLLASGSRSDDKRKGALGHEKVCSEVTPSQRLRRSNSVDRPPSRSCTPSDVALAFSEARRFGLMVVL